jgi:TonB family protein
MPNDSLEQFFDDLLSESRTGAAIARRQACAAALAATPQNTDSVTLGDIAAHLDSNPGSGGDGILIAKLARDPDAIHELESSQAYLDRVAGEEQPVPVTLLTLVVGSAPAAHTLARLPERRSRLHSLRRKPFVLWGGAMSAMLLAGIIGYAAHDLFGHGVDLIASAGPGFAPGKNPVVRLQTAPSQGSASPAAPPTYTTANAPIPITQHAVSADDYPPVSIRMQEQGTVKVKYLVLKDGTVGDCQVEISSSFSRLDDAACVLARSWLFKPATVMGGSPVEYWLDASIVFQLK